MAITDGADQSSVTPRPYERPTKARLLVDCYDSDGSDCNDGSDGGIDTNGRQNDNPNPRPVS
ncbi:hypothetical protein CRV24_007452 [Beauveria bassiana]|nr:hypothetical protein CRV24_007452 [Beauveria bassiana]KAH8712357.1 hypothetical protein HC256_005553 [Beauveria bassiana]